MLWVWPLGRLSLYLGDVGFLCTYFLMPRGDNKFAYQSPDREQMDIQRVYSMQMDIRNSIGASASHQLHLRYSVWFYSLIWVHSTI